MSRSSILNFESLEGFRPRFPATLCGVVAIIVAMEISFRLIPEEKLVPGKSRQGEISFMEHKILPNFPAPKIVFLGSSRIRRAIVPKYLDRQLGLPDNSTINLGLASGRVFEALYLYEKNREKLQGAKLVVLNIDEWQLSSGWVFGSLYEMHAPWSERMMFAEATGNRLMLDGVFTTRQKLRVVPEAFSQAMGWRKPSTVDLIFDENNQILPPARKGKDIGDTEHYKTEIDAFYSHFQIHPVMLGHVERLAKLVKESGGTFVLMQLPNRDAYQAEVNKQKGAEYAQHIATLKGLAQHLKVPLCLYDHPTDCGLTDASFEDYGHMNPAGAKLFTEYMATLIKSKKWLDRTAF